MTSTCAVASHAAWRSAVPWTSCHTCGWSGGPFDYRCIEVFCRSPYGPDYSMFLARCPRCGARVPRR
jgi:hypothetical protein